MTEQTDDIDITESSDDHTAAKEDSSNENWEMTHPLTTTQLRILIIAFAVIVILIGIMMFWGFRAMYGAEQLQSL